MNSENAAPQELGLIDNKFSPPDGFISPTGPPDTTHGSNGSNSNEFESIHSWPGNEDCDTVLGTGKTDFEYQEYGEGNEADPYEDNNVKMIDVATVDHAGYIRAPSAPYGVCLSHISSLKD